MTRLHELGARWREDAARLRDLGQEGPARMSERHADSRPGRGPGRDATTDLAAAVECPKGLGGRVKIRADRLRRLAALATNPEGLGDLDADQVPELLGELETLRARLELRLLTAVNGVVAATADREPENHDGDRLLSAREVAERLGMDRRAVYRRADKWPFTRRLGPNTVRFSERGLDRWLKTR